jgi:transposase InsO family protein
MKRQPVATQVSGEGDAEAEKQRNSPTSSAVARAMRALGLVDKSIISLLSAANSHRNHAGVARQTMLAMLQFMNCAGPVLDHKIQSNAISTILVLLDLHRGDVNVKEPALQNLCKVFQLDDAGIV